MFEITKMVTFFTGTQIAAKAFTSRPRDTPDIAVRIFEK